MSQNSSRKQNWKQPPDDKKPIFLRSELDDYGLNVYEFRVLAHIARRQGKRGCFSKQKTIAETCKMSPRKAQDVLRVLCGAGLIEREERDGTTNIYTLAPASQWKHPSELGKIRKTWKFTETKQAKDTTKDTSLDGKTSLSNELAS
ncbi:helix-turn-helix domain-containing protein [Lusitaniella coriacea]|uniref:helix-turn-helix domain-containing protein n=1 Tax=Lusitaniella coriacea TaxID=1983105 RepID=UPI003CEAA915